VSGRGGRSYAQKEQEATLPRGRPETARSRLCEICGTQQPQFSPFKEKLQVRNGSVHHLVLFRTSPCIESSRCPSISSISGISGFGSRNCQSAACRSQATCVRSCKFRLLSPELAAGIRRGKGVKQLGARTGNWLPQDQARFLLQQADGDGLRSARDLAMLSLLVGCGVRRAELSALRVEDLQIRQGHWAIVDLVGKGGHVRTVPMPAWVKDAVDRWRQSAKVTACQIFRAVSRY